MQRKFWAIATFIVGLVLAIRVEAVMVMPFNIEELAKRADKVFVGTCTKVSHSVNAQGVPVVEVTFAVTEAVKGEVGTTVTFQQIDPHSATTVGIGTHRERAAQGKSAGDFFCRRYRGSPELYFWRGSLIVPGCAWKVGIDSTDWFYPREITGHDTRFRRENDHQHQPYRKPHSADGAFPDPGKTAQYDQFLKVLRTYHQTHNHK